MKYVYKTIPTHPQFEICDEAPMELAVRNIQTKEYCKVSLQRGYPRVYLPKTKHGDGKHHFIHQLVCEVFYGPCPEGMEIDHRSTIHNQFFHENLHYVNHKENMNNDITLDNMSIAAKKRMDNYLIREKISNSQKERFKNNHKLNENISKIQKERFKNPIERLKNKERSIKSSHKKSILQIDKYTGEILNEFSSLREAGRILNIPYQGINAVCKGKKKTCHGFIWKYKTTSV